MKKLKIQDANWIIYQPDGSPAHWDLGESFRQSHAALLRGVPDEQVNAFLSSHFLDALDAILVEQDWEADFDGFRGIIEVTSRQGELTEAAIHQWMEAAIDDAVEMLATALQEG